MPVVVDVWSKVIEARPDDSMLTGSPCHGRRHLESIQRGSLEADWRPHARGSSLPAGSTRRHWFDFLARQNDSPSFLAFLLVIFAS